MSETTLTLDRKDIEDALTQAHAAGMERAAKEAASWQGLKGREIAKKIRALASSDPAPRDQRNATAEDTAMFDAALRKSTKVIDDGVPPAPLVEPGEVERLRAIETAASFYKQTFCCGSYPAEKAARDKLFAALSTPVGQEGDRS